MMHLKNNYDLIPNAIEEMLRYEPPVHATVRFAESDMIYNEKSQQAILAQDLVGSRISQLKIQDA